MMPEFRAATSPGAPDRANEDAYAVLPSLLVVADGTTSPASLGDGCMHGPAWYARRLICDVVSAHVEDAKAEPAGLLAEAITRTTAAHAGTCDIAHPGTPAATVAMITIAEDDTAHWLVLGDSTIILDIAEECRIVCDQRLSNTSEAERAAVLDNISGVSAEGYSRRIAALAHAQRSYRNRPGGFWVAATDPQAAHHALTGNEPCRGSDGLRRAALLTDGAARAVDTYHLMTWPTALDVLTREGPAGLLYAVRAAESADPVGSAFPRIKYSDDATAALVSWLDTRR